MAAKQTREQWLDAMTKALRPKFKAAGVEIPAKVRVSCAWPSEGALARKHRRVGECWPATASADKRVEIFISPTEHEGVRVAGILVHELIHAARPDASHGPKFKAAMGPLGLTGKATATTESQALKDDLARLIKRIGKYPHSPLKLAGQRTKTQTTRLLKIECPECGYTARTTAKWLEVGLPTCPCGMLMETK